jgi:hypothetical protein
MPLHVSSSCAYRQEVKIVLYSLWYHHTYRWPSLAQVERGVDGMHGIVGQQNIKICWRYVCNIVIYLTLRIWLVQSIECINLNMHRMDSFNMKR